MMNTAAPNHGRFLLLAGVLWTISASTGFADDPPEEACPDRSVIEANGKPTPWPSGPLVLEPEKTAPAKTPLPVPDQPEGLNGNFLREMQGGWGLLSSRMVVRDSGTLPESPFATNNWKTEQAVRMKVTGPLYVFGQVGTTCADTENQDLKLTGRTGLACKVPAPSGLEVMLRGSRSLTYTDPLRPERAKEQSDLQLELQCKCPLPGRLNLEYQGTATPALGLTERERLKQDLGLAIPLGEAGQFRLGAKHSWENTPAVKPWTEGMQLYIGVDLKR
jgi:hypothetical protein